MRLTLLAPDIVEAIQDGQNAPEMTLARWIERFFPEQRPDVIVSGDTHRECIETIDGVLCVNPGSPTYPHHYDTQLGIEPFDFDNPTIWK